MFERMTWFRIAFGVVLVAFGIDGYPLVSRSKAAGVAHAVYAEAIAHNLSGSQEDSTWLKIEDLGKSYIMRLNDLDHSDRSHALILSGIGSLIAAMGVLELFLLRARRDPSLANMSRGDG